METRWPGRRWPWGWTTSSGRREFTARCKQAQGGGLAGGGGGSSGLIGLVPAATSVTPHLGPGLGASLTLGTFTGQIPPSCSHPLAGHLSKSRLPLIRRKPVSPQVGGAGTLELGHLSWAWPQGGCTAERGRQLTQRSRKGVLGWHCRLSTAPVRPVLQVGWLPFPRGLAWGERGAVGQGSSMR